MTTTDPGLFGDLARRMLANPPRFVPATQAERLTCGLSNCPCPHDPNAAPGCDAGWTHGDDGVRRCPACQTHARAFRYRRQRPTAFADARMDDVDPTHRRIMLDWLTGPARTLIIAGRVGVGKSHAAYALTNHAAEHGADIAAWTVPDLLVDIAPEGDPSALRTARTAGLLLLDDLGVEKPSEWRVEQITGLADARIRSGLRQIITTNVPYADLAARYGERVMSRLTGGAVAVKLDGPDRRRVTW
ncbi:hypothetical protein BBK14_11370 [Parafrankia soli]|uniref:IstB-like ATP-binding domain-containing protein n=1 Tax=Parafrankia soli TaxID=2599596 RepID=A0A1S1R5J4_9ACTN|nr:ATP-binding protein [Parafrankia soli]OHV42213.1 hypothetical protein BBK14_11370 [Parafrankia soli]